MKSEVMMWTAIMALGVFAVSCGRSNEEVGAPADAATASRIETFTFASGDTEVEAKIFLPANYEADRNLPAIFLIDYTEQDFRLATDEFEKVIEGTQQVSGLDALVITLAATPDVDAEPDTFQEHYELFRSLTSHVHGKYTNNPARTFIGKGSESGVVLMALLIEDAETSVFDNFIATDPSAMYSSAVIEMLEDEELPADKMNKKLHFSFSTSNDREQCRALIDLIEGAQYPWLTFEAVEYSESDYETTYPISYAEGIQFVFSR